MIFGKCDGCGQDRELSDFQGYLLCDECYEEAESFFELEGK